MSVDLRYWVRHFGRMVYRREDWLLIRHATRDGAPLRSLPEGASLLRNEELRLGYDGQPARDARIDRRLVEGREIGLGVALDGRLVYDTWIRPGAYLEPRTGLLLGEGERGGVSVDAFTEPRVRGRGLHATMIERVLHEAHELGLDWLDNLVFFGNRTAQRALRKEKAEIVKWYICRRLLGLQWRTERSVDWHDLDLD